jgi:Domain of unknown function (DU1801)
MANQNKTKETEVDVFDFVDKFSSNERKKADSLQLVKIMRELTGLEPKMWGPSIIGFGSYHYKYDSGHEGDAPIIGFSPRKAAISLYIHSQTARSLDLLVNLGKYKISKVCIYINKLSDIDTSILQELCKETISYIQAHNECSCRIQFQ